MIVRRTVLGGGSQNVLGRSAQMVVAASVVGLDVTNLCDTASIEDTTV